MILDSDTWQIDRLEVGELMVNCYLIIWKPSGQGIVIDPGEEPDRILNRIRELGFMVTAIVNTHGHGDHIGANHALKAATSAPLLIGRNEAAMLTDPWLNLSAQLDSPVVSPPADRLLDEGDYIEVGGGRLKVYQTAGHSPGSIILTGSGFAVVGDLLFAGSIGRTDFPGGSLDLLLEMIREKVYPLGEDCLILPGHGPETTVGIERRSNPFLKPGSGFGW